MRHPLLAALVIVLAAPAPAHAYTRLAQAAADEPPVVIGHRTVAGFFGETGATLSVYDAAGAHPLALPGAGQEVMELAASAAAVAVVTGTPEDDTGDELAAAPSGAYYGPLSGPLTEFPQPVEDAAVAGSTVLSLESGGLVARAGGGTTRLRAAPGARNLWGAGHYAAYDSANGHTVTVLDVRSGRTLYKVPAGDGVALGADGRIAETIPTGAGNGTDRWPSRIETATVRAPKLRRVAALTLEVPRLALSGRRIAVVERSGTLGRLVVVGLDGRRRAVSARMNELDVPGFDAARVAFNAGHCVYAGAIPPMAPAAAPHDGCSDVPAELDFSRLDKEHAVHADGSLQVPLTCVAPTGAHCPATVRLTASDETVLVQVDVQVQPGMRTVTIAIPSEQLPLARAGPLELEQLVAVDPVAGAVLSPPG
jgi:hypothetical protein